MANTQSLKDEKLFSEVSKDATVTPSGVPLTIGEELKHLRLEKKQSLSQIAQQLRISERYLEAIENNDLTALPEQVYTLGFIKTYANHLELNGQEVVTKFKKELTPRSKSAVLDFPAPVPNRGIPRFSVLVIATFLTSLIYLLWYFLKAD